MFAEQRLTVTEPAPGLDKRQPDGLTRRLLLGALAAGIGMSLYPTLARRGPAVGSNEIPSMPKYPSPDAETSLEYSFDQPTYNELQDWAFFRDRFVRDDGRVIDTSNGGISHTESQGVGMLFAVTHDDQKTFDRIWAWTQAKLSRPSDALFIWRYDPNAEYPISDTNNATDGDIYIAGALARAARRWKEPRYREASNRIANDILSLLVAEAGDRTVLLPGAEGFLQPQYAIVNPSYYVFPLLEELRIVSDSAKWDRVIASGRALVREARFGASRLPSDWLQVSLADGRLSLPATVPPRFSFDAVRVALFMKWDHASRQDLAAFQEFWGRLPARAAAWVDLITGVEAPFFACSGVVAIASSLQEDDLAAAERAIPKSQDPDEYYSASLTLLSRMALRETQRPLTGA